MVTQYNAGLVFESENSNDLARKINELFEIGSMSKNLEKEGLDATEKFFNWEVTVQPLIKFYSKLAST